MSNEQEWDRIRQRIASDQGWTLCYCSARAGAVPRPVELCGDCVQWLIEHSPRIVASWRWFTNRVVFGGEGYHVPQAGPRLPEEP